MNSIKDSVVLITGASSGIGEATARYLSNLGAKVILCARNEKKLVEITDDITKCGNTAVYYTLDVVDYDSFQQVVNQAIVKFGRIDTIINNAGVMLLSPISEIKVDEWNQMIDINLKGTLNGVASVLPIMQKQQSGLIINVISTAAYRVMENSAIYSATKSAVKAFSEGLRKEEAKNGIRVNLIAPGPTKTNLLSHISSKDVKNQLDTLVSDTGLDVMDIVHTIVYQMSVSNRASVDEVIVSTAIKK